ncbi:MAG: HIT family protein [Chloroflexota bacterium]
MTGKISPPGGVVYEDDHWLVVLRSRPPLVPGQGFIILKRHCERLNELTSDEATGLGSVMQLTDLALDRTLKPEKVHFGLYAEGVRHLHIHFTPRTSSMPAGNIPLTFLGVGNGLLTRLHLKRPYADDAVAEVARQLRTHFTATPDRRAGTETCPNRQYNPTCKDNLVAGETRLPLSLRPESEGRYRDLPLHDAVNAEGETPD